MSKNRKPDKSPLHNIVKTNHSICEALGEIDRHLKQIKKDKDIIMTDLEEIKMILREKEKKQIKKDLNEIKEIKERYKESEINPSMNGMHEEKSSSWWFLT